MKFDLKIFVSPWVPLVAINIFFTSSVVQMTNCNLGNVLFWTRWLESESLYYAKMRWTFDLF